MIKYLTLLLFTFVFLNANNYKKIDVSYDVSYGILGKLGTAHASVDIQNNTYTIEVVAKATGMARILSKGREEIYTSSGTIKGSTFIPLVYTKISKNNSKNIKKVYTFDYENSKVVINKTNLRLKSTLIQSITGTKEKNKWVKTQSVQDLKYFAPNDLLSLFFNIKKAIPNFDKGSHYDIKAVGANKENGIINIIIPEGKKYKDLDKSLNIKSSEKFIAQINQKIFSSKKGELFISLNQHGICDKAVLKDVVMFGDIVGEMTDFKIKEI